MHPPSSSRRLAIRLRTIGACFFGHSMPRGELQKALRKERVRSFGMQRAIHAETSEANAAGFEGTGKAATCPLKTWKKF